VAELGMRLSAIPWPCARALQVEEETSTHVKGALPFRARLNNLSSFLLQITYVTDHGWGGRPAAKPQQ